MENSSTQQNNATTSQGNRATSGAEVVGAANEVLGSMYEFPRIAGMIQGALNQIISTQNAAMMAIVGEQTRSVTAVHTAGEQVVGVIRGMLPKEPGPGENPLFLEPKRRGYNYGVVEPE
jgi:hypothetical protein